LPEKIELVVPGHDQILAGTTLASPGQSNNRWSALERARRAVGKLPGASCAQLSTSAALDLNKIAELGEPA